MFDVARVQAGVLGTNTGKIHTDPYRAVCIHGLPPASSDGLPETGRNRLGAVLCPVTRKLPELPIEDGRAHPAVLGQPVDVWHDVGGFTVERERLRHDVRLVSSRSADMLG